MLLKQVFGAQIENNTDEGEMVILSSLLFFRSCNEQGDHEWFFFSDWQLNKSKEDDKLHYSAYLLLLFAGTALVYHVGSSKTSVLVWKLAKFKCFENMVDRNLSDYKGNILFY